MSDKILREILTELRSIRDLLQNPPREVKESEVGCECFGEHVPECPLYVIPSEKDELFEVVVADLSHHLTGFIVTTRWLCDNHEGMTVGRASALIDQLEAAGVISKPDVNGRRHVV